MSEALVVIRVDELRELIREEIAEAIGAKSTDVEPLWDGETTARYLDVTERTLANLRARGLPFRRVGDLVKYDRAEVDEWTREQARGECT